MNCFYMNRNRILGGLLCVVLASAGTGSIQADSLEEKAAALEKIPLSSEERKAVDIPVKKTEDLVIAAKDSDILDFPGQRDGEVIGEILQYDEIVRVGTVNDVWSQILFLDEKEEERTGYILSSALEGYQEREPSSSGSDSQTQASGLEGKLIAIEKSTLTDNAKEENTGTALQEKEGGQLHEGSGEGIFSDAVTEVSEEGDVTTVQIGTPVSASSDASLIPLGVFRITHYCPCSICCGPYTDGITSTGVTATTNHTIAVYPPQIPYGSRVVINGQVYVAEDCGGGIKENCIDIYVATHQEGEDKGVYYTDVYLLQ